MKKITTLLGLAFITLAAASGCSSAPPDEEKTAETSQAITGSGSGSGTGSSACASPATLVTCNNVSACHYCYYSGTGCPAGGVTYPTTCGVTGSGTIGFYCGYPACDTYHTPGGTCASCLK